MALIRGEMTSEDGSLVYATVEHHKVNVPTKPEHMTVRLPGDVVFEKEKGVRQVQDRSASKL